MKREMKGFQKGSTELGVTCKMGPPSELKKLDGGSGGGGGKVNFREMGKLKKYPDRDRTRPPGSSGSDLITSLSVTTCNESLSFRI